MIFSKKSFIRQKKTTLDEEEILESLELHDETTVNALLCLHEVAHIEKEYCVYNRNDWFTFHRHFLCIYPPARIKFCQEIAPFFPNLFLNVKTINAGLSGLHIDYSKIMNTIIYHLTALNDVYFHIFNQEGMSGDRACDALENHYRNEEISIGASRDKNNKELTFEFEDVTGNRKLYCDLHTKIWQYFEYKNLSSDATSDRIYFHQPIEGFKNDKVLVARIGKHA